MHAGQDHRPLRAAGDRGLNRALLVKAAEQKVVRLDKVRADTTVVAANVAYPTDSRLLVRAITLMVALVARIRAAGSVDLGAPEAAHRAGKGAGAGDHR